jgi:hypothetical protein
MMLTQRSLPQGGAIETCEHFDIIDVAAHADLLSCFQTEWSDHAEYAFALHLDRTGGLQGLAIAWANQEVFYIDATLPGVLEPTKRVLTQASRKIAFRFNNIWPALTRFLIAPPPRDMVDLSVAQWMLHPDDSVPQTLELLAAKVLQVEESNPTALPSKGGREGRLAACVEAHLCWRVAAVLMPR